MLSKTEKTLLSLLLLLCFVFIFLYYKNIFFIKNGEIEKRQTIKVTNKSLRENNPDFSSGLDAINRGDLVASQKHLSEALSKESDVRGQSIIRLNKATAYLRLATSTADKTLGVTMVNSIVDDVLVPVDIKAYAIQNLCQWYLAVRDDDLYAVIFNDEHYKIYKGSTSDRSINNLFQYSIKLYPLSIPLLKTTLWNTEILLASSTASKSTKDGFSQKVSRVLDIVDKDTATVISGGNTGDTASIFLARARLLASLEKLTGNQGFGNPVEYFSKSYERAQLSRTAVTKGYILLYLSSYYLDKKDIENLNITLGRFVKDTSILRSPFKVFLTELATSKKSEADLNFAVDLRKMASINSNFKKLLEENGWVFAK